MVSNFSNSNSFVVSWSFLEKVFMTNLFWKEGVPVYFSEGCLYSNPPLYRYRANHSQGMCTVCTLSGGHLYTSPLFLPGLPIINAQQRFNEHVCETDNCLCYKCSKKIVSLGLVCQTTAVQWVSAVRRDICFFLLKWKRVKKFWLWQFFSKKIAIF